MHKFLFSFQFSKPGKLLDVGNPNIQNGSKVTDFVWDPFDDNRLVVGRLNCTSRIDFGHDHDQM